jgi:hypothetical protein
VLVSRPHGSCRSFLLQHLAAIRVLKIFSRPVRILDSHRERSTARSEGAFPGPPLKRLWFSPLQWSSGRWPGLALPEISDSLQYFGETEQVRPSGHFAPARSNRNHEFPPRHETRQAVAHRPDPSGRAGVCSASNGYGVTNPPGSSTAPHSRTHTGPWLPEESSNSYTPAAPRSALSSK